MKGTWQTSSHGSGTAALAVLAIVGLAVAAGSGAAARAVHVADELLHAVLITLAVLAGIAIAAIIARPPAELHTAPEEF